MINIVFGVINSAILLTILVYLVMRSLPALRHAIEQEQALETDLHDEHHQLILKQRTTEESTRMQDEECGRLLVKINRWKTAVDSAIRGADDLAAREREELQRRIGQQSEYYRLHTMYQKLSPQVIADLEASLKTYYSDEKRAHVFVDRFIEGLKK